MGVFGGSGFLLLSGHPAGEVRVPSPGAGYEFRHLPLHFTVLLHRGGHWYPVPWILPGWFKKCLKHLSRPWELLLQRGCANQPLRPSGALEFMYTGLLTSNLIQFGYSIYSASCSSIPFSVVRFNKLTGYISLIDTISAVWTPLDIHIKNVFSVKWLDVFRMKSF